MYVGKGVAGQFGLGKMYGYLAFHNCMAAADSAVVLLELS